MYVVVNWEQATFLRKNDHTYKLSQATLFESKEHASKVAEAFGESHQVLQLGGKCDKRTNRCVNVSFITKS